jgi:hypothetical protein
MEFSVCAQRFFLTSRFLPWSLPPACRLLHPRLLDRIPAVFSPTLRFMPAVGTMLTNVNLPNTGQMPAASSGFIVETYAHFRRDQLVPTFHPQPSIHL